MTSSDCFFLLTIILKLKQLSHTVVYDHIKHNILTCKKLKPANVWYFLLEAINWWLKSTPLLTLEIFNQVNKIFAANFSFCLDVVGKRWCLTPSLISCCLSAILFNSFQFSLLDFSSSCLVWTSRKAQQCYGVSFYTHKQTLKNDWAVAEKVSWFGWYWAQLHDDLHCQPLSTQIFIREMFSIYLIEEATACCGFFNRLPPDLLRSI